MAGGKIACGNVRKNTQSGFLTFSAGVKKKGIMFLSLHPALP